MKSKVMLLTASMVLFFSMVARQLMISVPRAHAAYTTESRKAVDIVLHSSKSYANLLWTWS